MLFLIQFSSIDCLQRIQEFLLLEPRQVKRQLDIKLLPQSISHPFNERGTDLSRYWFVGRSSYFGGDVVLGLKNSELRWYAFRSKGDDPLTLSVSQCQIGTLIMVARSVGCRKSTFFKALLGEV